MVSANKALTGKRVYKGVSQSPNVGQVSAKGSQGYIKRELRKKNNLQSKRLGGTKPPIKPKPMFKPAPVPQKPMFKHPPKAAQASLLKQAAIANRPSFARPVGRDGKSDSRSAVAAKALNRMKSKSNRT